MLLEVLSLMANSSALKSISIDFPDSAVFRIAKNGDPLLGSRISKGDSKSLGGNRFDLVDEGTIYCSTELVGGFAEVLSHFRKVPLPRINIDQSTDPGFMLPGGVPADWRMTRSIFSIKCMEPLPFLHLEEPETMAFMDGELTSELLTLGVTSPLDIPFIRGKDRRITRAIAAWTARQSDSQGEPTFGGIRYTSRLGNWECWAIFEETDARIVAKREIKVNEPDLLRVSNLYQLTVH